LTSSGYQGSNNNNGSILESLSEDDSSEMMSSMKASRLTTTLFQMSKLFWILNFYGFDFRASSMVVNHNGNGQGSGPSLALMTPMSPR